jgi:hypothetical protein
MFQAESSEECLLFLLLLMIAGLMMILFRRRLDSRALFIPLCLRILCHQTQPQDALTKATPRHCLSRYASPQRKEGK